MRALNGATHVTVHCRKAVAAAGCTDEPPGLRSGPELAGLQQEFVSVHSLKHTLQRARFFMKELLAAVELHQMQHDLFGGSISWWQKRSTLTRTASQPPCSRGFVHSLGCSWMTLVWGFPLIPRVIDRILNAPHRLFDCFPFQPSVLAFGFRIIKSQSMLNEKFK